MSDRFSLLRLKSLQSEFDLAPVSSQMLWCGYKLEFPGGEDVVVVQDNAEQVRTPHAAFAALLRTERSVCFQWWRSTCEDVFCTLTFDTGAVSIEFGMDGMLPDEELAFMAAVLRMARHFAEAGTALGVVVDRAGVWAGFDWKRFFGGQGVLDSPLPDILGIATDQVDRILDAPASVRRQEIGDFTLCFSM